MSPARRSGFTLVEMLVVIGIIAVLVGILLPILGMAREAGRCANCLSNLKQIGAAFQMYANDHNGYMVPGDYFGQSDSPATFWSAGNWAVILAEGNYLPIPEGMSTSPTSVIVGVDPSTWEGSNILRCPDYADLDLTNASMPTSQTDPRGAGYVIRHDDFSLVGVRTWYAMNGAPMQHARGGKPLPMQWIPDFDPVTGVPDWHINKVSSFDNIGHLPLIFDGAWTLDFVSSTSTTYDVNRINARHYNGKYTNVLCADGHCETDATNTLPNSDWYIQ